MRSAFLSLFVLALASTAQATSFRDISLEELTARSTVVVEAEVTQRQYRQQPGRLPVVTDTELRVVRYLRGNGPQDAVSLWQPGGVLDGMRYHVVGSPELEPGDRVLLFLKPKPGYGPGTYYLFALELGVYKISRGHDGVLWAVRPGHGAGQQGAVQMLPQVTSSQSLPQALPLWQLVSRVRAVK